MEAYAVLEKRIVDFIKEAQIKLGYQSEAFRIYYPLSALNKLLGTDYDVPRMLSALREFSAEVGERLGPVQAANIDERFCITVPRQGVDYIHEHLKDDDFLVRFIQTITRHDCTLEDLVETFRAYSDKVVVKKASCDDFDYLIYFEDGVPNDYRYCITFEECHVIYHRFTVEDYEAFGFEV